MKALIKITALVSLSIFLFSCENDFLDTIPLSAPSDATYWTSEENATMWINYAYRSLPSANDYQFDSMSDDCVGTGDLIAQGLHVPNSGLVSLKWN